MCIEEIALGVFCGVVIITAAIVGFKNSAYNDKANAICAEHVMPNQYERIDGDCWMLIDNNNMQRILTEEEIDDMIRE